MAEKPRKQSKSSQKEQKKCDFNEETNVNKVNFYQDTIKRNDLKKSGKLEYTSTINLRDTFNDTELLRKRYIKSIDREKRKSQLSQ